MATPQPRTRRCDGCGFRFVPDGDQWFCSAICACSVSMASVVLALRRFAQASSPRPGHP